MDRWIRENINREICQIANSQKFSDAKISQYTIFYCILLLERLSKAEAVCSRSAILNIGTTPTLWGAWACREWPTRMYVYISTGLTHITRFIQQLYLFFTRSLTIFNFQVSSCVHYVQTVKQGYRFLKYSTKKKRKTATATAAVTQASSVIISFRPFLTNCNYHTF